MEFSVVFVIKKQSNLYFQRNIGEHNISLIVSAKIC